MFYVQQHFFYHLDQFELNQLNGVTMSLLQLKTK